MPSLQSIEVCIDDNVVVQRPTTTLTFGRTGHISLDHEGVPEIVGLLEPGASGWVIKSANDQAIEVKDRCSASSMRVAPGCSAPLFFDQAAVRFWIGRAKFGFDTRRIDQWSAEPMKLSTEQRQLLVGLARPRLSGACNRLPRNQDLAREFGWSRSKLNRKLDQICKKFSERGVPGLHGSPDRLASQRRRILIDHVIELGLITTDDVAQLDTSAFESPLRAAS